jgi:4-hydroxybenzoate polyprenyltransferase
MTKINDIYRLFRIPNLLMIVLVQSAVCYLLQIDKNHWWIAALIMLATLLIAAGGYLLNNAFDVEIDAVNHPGWKIEEYQIRKLKTRSYVLLLSGVLAGFWASYVLAMLFFPLFVTASLVLVLYAYFLSRFKIIGNVMISLLVALAPMAMFFMMFPLSPLSNDIVVVSFILVYSFFAFFLNWIREIVKDIEDFEGDSIAGRKSVATVFGIQAAKMVAGIFWIVFMLLLSFVLIRVQYYLLFGVLSLAGLVFLTMLYRANAKKDYTDLSIFVKLIMLAGLISPFFI